MKRVILIFIFFNLFVYADIYEDASKGKIDKVKSELKDSNFEGINKLDDYGSSLLHIAVEEKNIELINYLMCNGADIDIPDDIEGASPLMRAAQSSSIEVLNLLIEKGADVNKKNYIEMNVLVYGVMNDNIEIIKKLLDKQVDVNNQDEEGKTVLHRVLFSNNEENAIKYMKVLLDNAIKIDIQDNQGDTALIEASKNHFRKIVAFLASEKADLDTQNGLGNTALMESIINGAGDQETAKLLITLGADTSIINNEGDSAGDLSYYYYGSSTEALDRPGLNEVINLIENR